MPNEPFPGRGHAIPAPEPDLTPRQLIDRATALRPPLRAQQEACEAAGRILPETNQAFLNAGFYRTLQPRRFGGLQGRFSLFSRITEELTYGCASSAWVYCLLYTSPSPRDS